MRIEGLEDKQISWMLRPLTWMMKRRFGKVLNPFKALAYRPAIAIAMSVFTQSVESSKVTDPALKRLVMSARRTDDRLRLLNRYQRCRWQPGWNKR